MKVAELIEKLKEFPPDLPVQIKHYGCGCDSWFDLQETQVQDMVSEDKNLRICEIDASYN